MVYSPSKGEAVWGVFSWRISMNTENATKIDIPSDIFSPESTGTLKFSAERTARTTVGMMMFNR